MRQKPPIPFKHFSLRAVLCVVALQACTAFAGEIRHIELPSKALARNWNVNVYVPDETKANDMPLIILLHGRGGNYKDWADAGDIKNTLDELIASKQMPPSVVVMPDGFNCWFLDMPDCKVETAIMRELIPYATKTYNAGKDRSTRYIAGLSMGGYGALNISLKYPNEFKAAGLLSPAVYAPLPPDNSSARKDFATNGQFDEREWIANLYTSRLPTYFAQRSRVKFYIHSGDDDEFFVENDAARLYNVMRKHENLAELRIENGKHSWDVWKASVRGALAYFFADTKKEPDH